MFLHALSEDGFKFEALAKFTAAYEKMSNFQAEAAKLLAADLSAVQSENTGWLECLLQKTVCWVENLGRLREWCAWLSCRTRAIEVGLSPLVAAYEFGELQDEEVTGAFEKALYRSCAEYIIAHEPALNNFSGKLFEEKIRQFRQTNGYFEGLTRQEIYARLAAKIPIPNFVQEASQSSELGILQRAVRSGGMLSCVWLTAFTIAAKQSTTSRKRGPSWMRSCGV